MNISLALGHADRVDEVHRPLKAFDPYPYVLLNLFLSEDLRQSHDVSAESATGIGSADLEVLSAPRHGRLAGTDRPIDDLGDIQRVEFESELAATRFSAATNHSELHLNSPVSTGPR
jgi:hypothetical protein